MQTPQVPALKGMTPLGLTPKCENGDCPNKQETFCDGCDMMLCQSCYDEHNGDETFEEESE